MRGTVQAEVHDVFSNRLDALTQDAQTNAAAYTATGQRIWQVPAGVTDLFDLASLHDPAFDRQPINDQYVQVMEADDPGTIGDVVALKQQIDYVTMEERAFRLRHITPCRGVAFAAGRRYGHGVGNVFPNVRSQVLDAIAAGGQQAPDFVGDVAGEVPIV